MLCSWGRTLRVFIYGGMRDRSMRSGTKLAREIQLTDWSTAGNLSNRSSGVQIPRDICTRFGRYLYSTRCSWIINIKNPWVKQPCYHKTRDVAKAFRVRKRFGTLEISNTRDSVSSAIQRPILGPRASLFCEKAKGLDQECLNTLNFVKNFLLRMCVVFLIHISVFGYPDETQSFVFDALLHCPIA